MSYSWSWSSGNSCSSKRKIVYSTTQNGTTVTTTTYPSQGTFICPIGQSNYLQNSEQQLASSYSHAAEPAADASQFEQECLDEHNRLRALHGCPPLKLSRHLSAYASEWAKHIARLGNLQHRSERTYGENLYMMSAGCPIDGKVPVKSWYDEINQYNYSRPGFSMTTGHFTQVVWKDTKEMGVAVERRNNGTWVVANYSPHGNFNNQYVQNVPQRLR